MERAAQRIQLELEDPTSVVRHGLHRRALPLRFVVETHIDHGCVGIEALGRRANRKVAVAPDDGITGAHHDALHRHGFARQRCAEQQMPAAETPMTRRPRDQECEAGDADGSDDARNGEMRFRNDVLDRRAFRDLDGIFGKQLFQERRTEVGFPASQIEIGLNPAALLGQPPFELIGTVRLGQFVQRPPQQSRERTCAQRDDQGTARPCERCRITCSSEPSDEGDRQNQQAARNRGCGTQIDESAQPCPQLAQVAL
jgi:hypothetical protein